MFIFETLLEILLGNRKVKMKIIVDVLDDYFLGCEMRGNSQLPADTIERPTNDSSGPGVYSVIHLLR